MIDSERFLCQAGSRCLAGRAKRDLAVALSCVALGLAFASPRSARACSTAPSPAALVGYPGDGETNVPTDVVPFYNIAIARIADVATAQFALTSAAGDTMAVQAELSHAWHVDLVPVEPLQPNTSYRIGLSLPDGESVSGVSFTTSAGPFQGVPAPPTASLQHYQFASSVPYSSCSPSRTGTCVALSKGLPVEMTHLWNGNADHYVYLYEGSVFANLSGIDQGTPFDCIRLRSRAPNRVYSAAVQLCRDDGPLVTLTSDEITCTAEGLMQRDARAEPPSVGEDRPGDPEAAAGANAIDGDTPGPNQSVGCSFSATASLGAGHIVAVLLAAAAVSWRRASTRRGGSQRARSIGAKSPKRP